MPDEIERLKARLKREKEARKEAEAILEDKSIELYHSNLELKELTKHLEFRVEERTAELEKARDEALQLAEVKSEFLANMSHELRTPLNGVLGMLALLNNTELNGKQSKLLSTAVNSGELLLTLINDVLDLSKLEHDQFQLEHIAFNPAELIQLTCEPFVIQAVAKNIELIYILTPDMPLQLQGDPTRIKQILTNLVSNALKFTEEGEVLISAYFEEGELVLSVSDTGIGMTSNQIDRVLDKFSQANESTTRKYGGTGLGLAICQKLVDAMDGMISIQSTPGEGSCFEVALPLSLVEGDLELFYPTDLSSKRFALGFQNSHILHYTESLLHFWNIKQMDQATSLPLLKECLRQPEQYDFILIDQKFALEEGNDLFEWILEVQPSAKLVSFWPSGTGVEQSPEHYKLFFPVKQSDLFDVLIQSPEQNYRPDLTHVKDVHSERYFGSFVLLVEDNLVNQEVARELLNYFGCDVTTANNGEEALNKIQETEFDLVLMDIQMPVMDGITATKEVRALGGHFLTLPMVALTAHSLSGDREKSLAAGLDDHITKPIELNQLARILGTFLSPAAGDENIPVTAAPAEPLVMTPDPSTTSVLKVLDVAAALNRILNNQDLYVRVLKEFFKATVENLTLLQEAFEQRDLDIVISISHTLKGSSANIGGERVQKSAAKLESLAKEVTDLNDDTWLQLATNSAELEQELASLLNEVEQYLKQHDGPAQKTENEMSPQDIQQLCLTIQESIYADLAHAGDAITQLESVELADNIEVLVRNLRASFQAFDFTAIESDCEKIIREVK